MTSVSNFLGAIFLLLQTATVAQADSYIFGDGEKIMLRVGEWNSADRNFRTWDGLSGDYTVGPDGTVSLPIAGTVTLTGKTADVLAEEIADLLQRRIGLAQKPAVSLQVMAYKPIYIGGSVSRPGSYAFDYDMTVEQAIAVAGGLFRPATSLNQNASQQLLQLRSEVDRLQARIAELATAEARLMAELEAYDSANLSDPVDFDGSDTRQGLLQMQILEANRAAIRKRQASLTDLEGLLREQIATMTTEIGLRDRQLAAARENLESTESLAERGLAVNSRVSDQMFAVNDYEAKRLQLALAKLTAEQQLNAAQRDMASLVTDARAKLLQELSGVRSELDDTRLKLDGLKDLYAEASLAAGAVIADAPMPMPQYAVSRWQDGKVVSLTLGPTDRLKPGDTLSVEIVLGAGTLN